MLIVIVGAGAVGAHLAERLSVEGQDVVLIDSDKRRAQEMRERIDALVVTGNGASRAVLIEAGVENADLLIAVSSNDGANILAAHAARNLGVRKTIARVGDPGLRFYAGCPLRGPNGYKVGTFCLADTQPRELEDAAIRLTEVAVEHGLLRVSDPRVSALAVVGAVEQLAIATLRGRLDTPPAEIAQIVVGMVQIGRAHV